jgi:hypothetical protein
LPMTKTERPERQRPGDLRMRQNTRTRQRGKENGRWQKVESLTMTEQIFKID